MRELLSLPGILVNAADEDREIPLIYTARWRKEASLSLLLAHPKIDVNAPNSDGTTALMSASSEEIATLLLTHPKIKPNLVDSDGDTALMGASRWGYLEIVKVLLADPRVKVTLKSRDGKTALDMAVQEHEYRQLHPLKALLRRALPSSRKK
ncbi:ankyrin repeat-containing domain protein [Coprinopsis sp. MPI-PUGE-AT-0042]|nr:ankyrin repeat-containing domain protein [Coprinopsis sp. MPI-PUGE-AT-0042]